MQPKRIFCALILILTLGGLSACQGEAAQPDAIRIGVIEYLKNEDNALSGQTTEYAARLAVLPITQAGGLLVDGQVVPVELVVLTIDDTPEAAVAATRELINQKGVVAIVGPQNSTEAIPAGEVAEAARIPMICPIATNPQVTQGRQYVFRMSFRNDLQGIAMANLAYEELGARRAAVIYNAADTYSSSLADIFRQSFQTAGGEVAVFDAYATGVEDFTPRLTRVLQQNADVLFLPNNQSDVLAQGLQARQVGYAGLLLGGDGWDQYYLPEIPEFDGAYMIGHCQMDLEDANTSTFFRAYQSAFELAPNDTAALTYDAVNMILQAIQRQGGYDPQSIRDGLLLLEPYPGVCGSVDFTDSGDPTKSVIILHFIEGGFDFYEQVNP